MTVHAAYLDYLTGGALPEPLPSDASWSIPQVQRSPWFDLLNQDDRSEAFRGLWGIMAYMTRDGYESVAKRSGENIVSEANGDS